MSDRVWWKEAIVYQIYPRSFKDSNGDGVGDLQGIISKLDYIQSLGVDAVWLNPIYKSPNDDGGYDISDYYSIQPEFGSMQDFDELLAGLHQRGLKLIMDLVLNHSSDEHPWFEESKKSKSNSFRDYYFWKPGKNGHPPNNWPSFFGGNAWQLDDRTGEYYLHLFSVKQPDLNWENIALRKDIHELMRYWLKRGVDGLRLDVISAISKRTDFPPTDTADFNETIRRYYSNGPRLQEFIGEVRTKVINEYKDVMTVGEGPGITPQNALDYLDLEKGLNMIFHFGHMFMDQGPGGRFDPIPWSMTDFKKVFKTWDDTFAKTGWGSIFLGNHDFARMVSRWGDDSNYWRESSIETHNGWRDAQKRGISEEQFLSLANYSGRDNARTPMQWDDSVFGGFTSGQPWMELNPNKSRINVVAQTDDPNSILNYFRSMASLRKMHPALTYGSYEPIETKDERFFVYYRQQGKEKYQIVLHFSNENSTFPIPQNGQRLIGNYADVSSSLRPWEAMIYKL